MFKKLLNKRGQTANIGALVGGIIGLVFLVVVGFVSINMLTSADLLTANSAFDNATNRMVGNLTTGVDTVSSNIPTIFAVVVAVLILGFIVFLAVRARQVQQAQGQSI